jgi:hypothetical protein
METVTILTSHTPILHMRYTLLLVALFILLRFDSAQSQGLSTPLQKVVDRASYEFSNEAMYRNQAQWLGMTISFKGTFVLKSDVLNVDQPYQQLVGKNSGGEPVDVLVFFDAPLQAGRGYGESGTSLSVGDEVRVFGIVQKCREVVTRTGYIRVLPVLDLLIAFRQTDESMTNPVFVNKDLRR